MRKWISDGSIIAFLCAALLIEVSLLLWHMNSGDNGNRVEGSRPAGQVIIARNQLRRRGLNSLIWEPSQSNESVYYHDSILTLEGSEARIQLEGRTEIHVSENTLVTVEPPENRESGEIRLKFIRGNMRARNPFAQARLNTDTLSVAIKPGSDVDLRQVSDGRVELRVQKGSADILDPKGNAVSARQGEFLRFEQDQVRRFQVDAGLAWMNPPSARLYSHEKEVQVALQWQGSPETLVIQSVGAEERFLEVKDKTSLVVALSPGQHRLLLRARENSSLPADVQILKAPLIHLLSPLPRDRVELNKQVLFQWIRVPGVVSHEWRAQGRTVKLSEKVKGAVHALTFEQEDEVEWSVFGLDAEGFEIPPLYSYPLYLRANPLAPPKLKSPALRRPAQEPRRGAFWERVQDLLFPRAYAEEVSGFEALFSWEAVPSADQYVIEISETADFRQPLVTRTVHRPEFLWKGFSLKTYFWRVAAGSRSGRLGVFSEPATVHLEDSANGQGEVDGVAVRPIVKPTAKSLPKEPDVNSPRPAPDTAHETVMPPEEKSPAPLKPVPVEDARNQSWAAFLQPGYKTVQIQGDDNVNAQLNGPMPMAVRLEWPVIRSEEKSVRLDLSYQKMKFEPRPREEYPFQEDLEWSLISVTLMRFKPSSRWGYGWGVGQRAKVNRSDYESIEAKSDWIIGPATESSWVRGRQALIARGRVLFSTGAVGGAVEAELRRSFGMGFVGGVGVEGTLFLGSGRGFVGAGYLSLGFEF